MKKTPLIRLPGFFPNYFHFFPGEWKQIKMIHPWKQAFLDREKRGLYNFHKVRIYELNSPSEKQS